MTPGGLDKVFICSTGAEAVDSALKLARLSTKRSKIVAANGAFHGYTLGALSVCGIPSQRRPFEPLLPGIEYVPFGDTSALADSVTEETAALLLEPIQAEVGGETPPAEYLRSARDICNRVGALLVIDEVRTAVGRTGPFLAIERDRIEPDILAIGKSLAGGIIPIGAILAKSSLGAGLASVSPCQPLPSPETVSPASRQLRHSRYWSTKEYSETEKRSVHRSGQVWRTCPDRIQTS